MTAHRLSGAAAVTVALLAFLVFSPALWQGFADWDDPVNFLDNPHYRGLGWTNLSWMFTTVLMGQWIPLAWVTLGLDYVLWGMNPAGYHLTNLLLHAANAGLFVLLARRLLRRAMPMTPAALTTLGAAVAGFVFAIHPLRVESVAWVTERRDVLSGLFFLLTILAYLRACDADARGRTRWLALSLALYVPALLAKPMVTTLPVLLIILDIYPLGRIRLRPHPQQATHDPTRPRGPRYNEWKEKVPYFVLSAIAAVIAILAMRANAGLTGLGELGLAGRLALIAYSLTFYLSKTIAPLGLSPLYELPLTVNVLELRFVASAIVVALVTALFIAMRRRWPMALAAWVAYVVILLPVSGLLHNGNQLVHDRYSYLACLGWALIAGAAVTRLARAARDGSLSRAVTVVALTGGGLAAAGLAVLTWQQVEVWRDGITLWEYAVESEPDCSICHVNLGVSLANHGYGKLAVPHFERALALRPDRTRVHGNLGVALLDSGRAAEAVPHFERVLAREPGEARTRASLGVALIRERRQEAGTAELGHALSQAPGDTAVLTNVGIGLYDAGRSSEAVPYFRRAIELGPSNPLPHFWLAKAYLALGAHESARTEYEAFRALDPALAGRLPAMTEPGRTHSTPPTVGAGLADPATKNPATKNPVTK